MRAMFDCSREGLSDRPNLMQNYWTKMQERTKQYVIWTYGLALILFGRAQWVSNGRYLGSWHHPMENRTGRKYTSFGPLEPWSVIR